MKKRTSLLLAIPMVLLFSASQAQIDEGFSESEAAVALESAGVPIHPGSAYLTGDDEMATVMWFSSDDSPDEIMDWYKDQLDGWSEIDVDGSRVICQGPPGVESSELSNWPYIFVRIKEQSVEPDSEITIRIPKEAA